MTFESMSAGAPDAPAAGGGDAMGSGTVGTVKHGGGTERRVVSPRRALRSAAHAARRAGESSSTKKLAQEPVSRTVTLVGSGGPPVLNPKSSAVVGVHSH